MEIKNKSIIITGASSGIGKKLAIILSSKGGFVSLLSRRKEEIEKLANKVTNKNIDKSGKIWLPQDVKFRTNF